MNLDRFSQTMPWEQEKNRESMIDYCLDCGAKIPFGKNYCNYCQDRIYEVNEVKKELIRLEEKCKKVISSLGYLISCSWLNASDCREVANKSKDSFEKGIKIGMAIVYEILALRIKEIKKELQEAAN